MRESMKPVEVSCTAEAIAHNLFCMAKGGADETEVLRCLNVALREAELRGARKMQEEAAKVCRDAGNFHNTHNQKAACVDYNREEDIRALKPEEVIK